jgi:hypothetical protein
MRLIIAVLVVLGLFYAPVEAYNTCTNFEVISDNSTHYNAPPSIFGDQVVWASEGNIVAYNLSNGVLEQITNDYWWKEDVEIFENRVVWVEYGPIAQIRGCDFGLNGFSGGCLENDSKIWITNTVSLKTDPVLFEGKLVWSEYDGNDFEIVGCDFGLNGFRGGCLENDSKIWITNNSYDDKNPDLFEGKLVWEFFENDWNIGFYDFLKGSSLRLMELGDQRGPKILKKEHRFYVVYSSNELNEDDIFYYSLNSKSKRKLNLIDGYDEWNVEVNNFGNISLFWQTSKLGISNLEGFDGEFIDASINGIDNQKELDLYGNKLVFQIINSGKEEIWISYC